MAALGVVQPKPPSPQTGLEPRRIGLLVGLCIGGVLAVVQHVVSFGELINMGGVPWTVPTIVTGGLVGWLFGPAAWRAVERGSWLGIVVGQALLAIVVGAFAVAVEGFLVQGLLETGDLADLPVAILLTGLVTLYGLVLVGWVVAPFAFAAAVLWALAMAAIRAPR